MIALSLIKNKKLKIIEKKIQNFLHPSKYRIQILYSGICASDIPRAFDGMAYSYPLIMGHEFVGRIVETGKNCNKFFKGDIVSVYPLIPCFHKQKKRCDNCKLENYNLCDDYSYYGSRTNGSFCEVLDVFEWNLFKISKKINLNLCSLIEPTAVAYNIINKFSNDVSKKTKILLIGSGFIGQIISRILKQKFKKSLNLTVLDRNNFKLKEVKKFSSDQYLFNGSNTNKGKNLFSNLKNKYDIVIENSGNNKNFLNAISFAKKGGAIIFSGNPNNDINFDKKNLSSILRKEIVIKGVWNSTFKKRTDNWKSAEGFLSNFKNNEIERLISHTVYLDDSAQLFNKIYISKKKKTNLNYIKGLIRSF